MGLIVENEFSDKHWMKLALDEAQAAFSAGDYPVGALLTIDDKFVAAARNTLFSDERTTAHAEHNLLAAHSGFLRSIQATAPQSQLCLYTTLEPCLMCLGISVLHRVSRIIVACPDPNGGTTNLNLSSLGSVYKHWWPTIEVGLYREQSCELIIQFLQTKKFRSWETMLAEFQQLQRQWEFEQAGE